MKYGFKELLAVCVVALLLGFGVGYIINSMTTEPIIEPTPESTLPEWFFVTQSGTYSSNLTEQAFLERCVVMKGYYGSNTCLLYDKYLLTGFNQ